MHDIEVYNDKHFVHKTKDPWSVNCSQNLALHYTPKSTGRPNQNHSNIDELPYYYFLEDEIYMGKDGWERYGVFSFVDLYKKTKWSLSIIEEYKDKIVWTLLLQFGDFTFEEDLLIKYANYIPWYHPSQTTLHQYAGYQPYLHCFKNIGRLSESFVKSNISRIYVPGLCSSGDFELNKETAELLQACLIPELYPNLLDESIAYELVDNKRISISKDLILQIANYTQIPNWDYLLKRVTITQDDFLDFYKLYPERTIKEILGYEFENRRKIFTIIESDSKLRAAINSNTRKNIWQGGRKYGYQGKFDNLPFILDLTEEVMSNNSATWNRQTYDVFQTCQRTPDTNYHYYERITAWDVLNFEKSFLLTYNMCKYLSTITVMTGGSHILEDGHYRTDDVPDKPINGLVFFRFHDVTNDEEFEKIANDEDLITLLLENTEIYIKSRDYTTSRFLGYKHGGGPIIDKLVRNFFNDFQYEKFVEIEN